MAYGERDSEQDTRKASCSVLLCPTAVRFGAEGGNFLDSPVTGRQGRRLGESLQENLARRQRCSGHGYFCCVCSVGPIQRRTIFRHRCWANNRGGMRSQWERM